VLPTWSSKQQPSAGHQDPPHLADRRGRVRIVHSDSTHTTVSNAASEKRQMLRVADAQVHVDA